MPGKGSKVTWAFDISMVENWIKQKVGIDTCKRKKMVGNHIAMKGAINSLAIILHQWDTTENEKKNAYDLDWLWLYLAKSYNQSWRN